MAQAIFRSSRARAHFLWLGGVRGQEPLFGPLLHVVRNRTDIDSPRPWHTNQYAAILQKGNQTKDTGPFPA